MQPPKSSICVICGVRPSTTSEHTPPKGFFKGATGQFITVPACYECNNGSSEDDELLRNYISAEVSGNTEASKKLWKDGGHKSFLLNNKFRKALQDTLQEVEVIDSDGESSTRLAFSLPISLYQRVFLKVTRCFFFYHTGNILPPGTPIAIDSLISAPETESLKECSICDGVFRYWYGIESDTSLWFYEIHGGHWVMAKTGVLANVRF